MASNLARQLSDIDLWVIPGVLVGQASWRPAVSPHSATLWALTGSPRGLHLQRGIPSPAHPVGPPMLHETKTKAGSPLNSKLQQESPGPSIYPTPTVVLCPWLGLAAT